MPRQTVLFLIPALVLAGAASLTLANSTGPLPSRTGAPAIGGVPAEATCNDVGCHSGNPLNSGGTLEILGAPSPYTPGTSYPITVRLTSTANQSFPNRRWGFQLTAVRLSDGQGAGSLSAPTLLVLNGNGSTASRQYVSHDADTFMQGASSPVEWTFTWTAPAQDRGAIGFYAAGNAANGNLSSLGDFIYTASSIVQSPGTPVQAVTWGALKSGAMFER
jgi:hypothetical protein